MFSPEHLVFCKERWGDIEVHETVLMLHPEMDAVSARELAGEACYLPPPVPAEQKYLSGNGVNT